jgi:branched-subunit amino acid transport protein
MTPLQTLLTILGMAGVTLLTRAFFLIPDREMPMPGWVKQGLRYAPLAAITAIVFPEVVMTQGTLIDGLQHARLVAVAAASVYFFWRRDILGTILSGTAALLLMHLGAGWPL